MMKPLSVLIAFGLCCATGFSQMRERAFRISLPDRPVPQSLYRTIALFDSRADTTFFGIVQTGMFNKRTKVVAEIPLSLQLTTLMDTLTDSGAASGHLLLHLRQLSFAELSGAFAEKGYFFMRAALYAQTGEQYQKLATIDTVLLVQTMDVTNALFRKGSALVASFIGQNMVKAPGETLLYTMDDIRNTDEIEKSTMPLYTTDVYKDGIYRTFESFRQQTPDLPALVDTAKNGNVTAVYYTNEKGKRTRLSSDKFYAVVYNGQPFIATEYRYCRLTKSGSDFYFTGKARVQANGEDVATASFFFGIMGGLVASQAEATFEIKIDHLKGGFIRVKEIEQ
jgi:hypothetical protein